MYAMTYSTWTKAGINFEIQLASRPVHISVFIYPHFNNFYCPIGMQQTWILNLSMLSTYCIADLAVSEHVRFKIGFHWKLSPVNKTAAANFTC